ncbi:MAG: DNA-protecting protein DprA [Betaproteobacteria bacterium]|nr:DNA-protecting protein DprA [Betaproteobacteria bacterium]
MPIPPAGAAPSAWLALASVPGLGPEAARKLLQAFGGPEAVLDASTASLTPIVGTKLAQAIPTAKNGEKVEAALHWLETPENHLLTWADEDYPARLLEIGDPPFVLYLKGQRALLTRDAIGIVGSRNATAGGVQLAEAFAESLSHAGLTIVSGMAMGIDAAAHSGGLKGAGSSIAVVGTGLDLVYPARNRALAHRLAEAGLIVSEFNLGTPAMAGNFPRRNRIISGLSRGILVVEATLNSGSLITARMAGEQGRDVFAIPGSIHSPFSKGCHTLIKQGAKLVDDASDILSELGLSSGSSAKPSVPAKSEAQEDADPLLTAMGYDPVTVDAIAERSRQDASSILAKLTRWEIEGAVVSLPGGKYQRVA